MMDLYSARRLCLSRYDKPAYSSGAAGMTETRNGQTLRRYAVYNSGVVIHSVLFCIVSTCTFLRRSFAASYSGDAS
jgi:hypothetical protein